MNPFVRQLTALGAATFLAAVIFYFAGRIQAQEPWPPGAPTTANDQRNLSKLVKVEVYWVQNAARTAPNYTTGGYDILRDQFQKLRVVYNSLKTTLTPRQLDYGANDLADLDAGLDIIQEAFTAYEEDLANGRSRATALRGLCRVVGQATAIWLQEFNRDTARLRIGWP